MQRGNATVTRGCMPRLRRMSRDAARLPACLETSRSSPVRDGNRARLQCPPYAAAARSARMPARVFGGGVFPAHHLQAIHGQLSASDAHSMDRMRHRRDRVCVRYLRAADVAAHSAAGTVGAAERGAEHRRVQLVARPVVLHSGVCGGHFRAVGRLPHRSAGAAARAHVEHFPVRLLGVRGRLLDVDLDAAFLPLHDVHRRVRGIRGGRRLAGGAVPRTAAARAGARLHAVLLIVRRDHGRVRQLLVDRTRGVAADDCDARMARVVGSRSAIRTRHGGTR